MPKGVTELQSQRGSRYIARIGGGTSSYKHLGTFDTAELASRAYNAERLKRGKAAVDGAQNAQDLIWDDLVRDVTHLVTNHREAGPLLKALKLKYSILVNYR